MKSLLSADMDGLKSINDIWGHHAGDQAIIATADILRATVRDTDIIARIGVDEFAGLSIDNDTNDAAIMVMRLRASMEAWNLADIKPYKLSFSIGLAEYDPRTPMSLENLLALADQRMYAEKKRK